jgi:hypothetical protein
MTLVWLFPLQMRPNREGAGTPLALALQIKHDHELFPLFTTCISRTTPPTEHIPVLNPASCRLPFTATAST